MHRLPQMNNIIIGFIWTMLSSCEEHKTIEHYKKKPFPRQYSNHNTARPQDYQSTVLTARPVSIVMNEGI